MNALTPPIAAKPQALLLTFVGVAALGLFGYFLDQNSPQALLFLLGLGIGVTLLFSAYGFSGAYRKLLTDKDMTGVVAQLVMLGIAIVIFAPILASGSVWGQRMSGSFAPVSVSVAVGAFMFGIGMQFARGCASGTLYATGSGNPRMALALLFFCIGAFWGSLDLGWWQTLPSLGVISLGHRWGWGTSAFVQIGVLLALFFALRRSGWSFHPQELWGRGLSWRRLSRGPWPLLFAAGMLALFNGATLLITGHGWSITWAFSLWAAKGAVGLGWDPSTSAFWASGFPQAALNRSLLTDDTSIMNIGILIGALAASALAGSYGKNAPAKANPLLAAIVGGLMLGYGARLSYGCNIGAFFSGVASGSLHGWLWILCALPGNEVGLYLRKVFKM